MAVFLPMDMIVAEILPRLPAKSLIRFKCVCKVFQTLISSPEFVNLHLRRSQSSEANRDLIIIGNHGCIYSYDMDSLVSPTMYPLIPQSYFDMMNLYLIGPCNGLVCMRKYTSLEDEHQCFILLNPSTGIYREIPSNYYTYPQFPLAYGYPSMSYGFGIGADGNDDYKIVIVKSCAMQVGEDREVIIYSLRSNSWRLVDKNNCLDCTEDMEKGAVINNHLVHWKFWNQIERNYRIGCFDLRNEQWGNDVPLPDYNGSSTNFADLLFDYYDSDKESYVVDLGVLNECLCLLTKNRHHPVVDVWIMKEYGVKESWVKLLDYSDSVVTKSLNFAPFGYVKGSSSEILLAYSNIELYRYNLRDKTRTKVDSCNVPPMFEACVSNGSLVTIAGGHQIVKRKLYSTSACLKSVSSNLC